MGCNTVSEKEIDIIIQILYDICIEYGLTCFILVNEFPDIFISNLIKYHDQGIYFSTSDHWTVSLHPDKDFCLVFKRNGEIIADREYSVKE